MKKIKLFNLFPPFLFTSIFFPLFAFAQTPKPVCELIAKPKFQDLIGYVTCILVKYVFALIVALGTLAFMYGVFQYVISSDDEGKKEKGRQYMIWGIIGLTVMVSVWGLVTILGDTFNLNSGGIPQFGV